MHIVKTVMGLVYTIPLLCLSHIRRLLSILCDIILDTPSVSPAQKVKPNGVSVHYLKTQFLQEVQDAGKTKQSKIYEIEDLNSDVHGVIRSKGAGRVCPRDQTTDGAAYVDCLSGEDNVGPATFLLSYCWGYTIGDIVDTLVEYCDKNDLDEKKTYAWICCICNNQHKVYKDKKSGVNVPFGIFHDIFASTVLGIGYVVAMMTPWRESMYLLRIWCIFELYTAYKNGCKLDIAMPTSEIQDMVISMSDIDELFKALGNTNIANAQASVEEDRERILKLVKENVGYAELDREVNKLIRNCVMKTMEAEVRARGCEREVGADDGHNALLYNLAGLMNKNGEHEKAMEYLDKALVEVLALKEDDHNSNCADIYDRKGEVYRNQGDYENALVEHKKGLEIRLEVLGHDHRSTADSYGNIGLVYYSQGDYENALVELKKGLEIQLKVLGDDHPHTADSYGYIGLVYDSQGDYENALVEMKKGLEIYLILGDDHPHTATSYINIGQVYAKQGDYENALVEMKKGLEIYLKVLGPDHPHTALSYTNIGMVYYSQGDYDNALVEFKKGLEIKLKVLGPDHPHTANSYYNLAFVYGANGDLNNALLNFQTSFDVYSKIFGPGHSKTINAQEQIDQVSSMM